MMYRIQFIYALLLCSSFWHCNPTSTNFITDAQKPSASSAFQGQFSLYAPHSAHAKTDRITLRATDLTPHTLASLRTDSSCSSEPVLPASQVNATGQIEFNIDLVEDGQYTYFLQSDHPTQNQKICLGPVTYRLDRIPPMITDISDGSGSQLALSTSESDNPVYVYDDDACLNEVGELLPDENGNDHVFAPDLTANGVFFFWVQTQDNAGNLSACEGPLLYIYNGANPDSLIGLPNRFFINTGNIEYQVNFNDVLFSSVSPSDVTVHTTGDVQYTVQVTNGTSAQPTIVIQIQGGNGSIDSISIPEGLGNNLVQNTPAAVQSSIVQIDNIAPTGIFSLSDMTPSPGDYTPILFDLTGNAPTDLAGVELFKNDDSCTSTPINTAGHPVDTNLSIASDLIDSGTGAYTYYARLTDAAGNTSDAWGPLRIS